MEYTNINILDGDRRFRYIIEYVNNAENNISDNLQYVIGDDSTAGDNLRCDMFQTGLNRYRRFNNYWKAYDGEVVDINTPNNYLPERFNLSSVNVYFPDNSVETYSNNNLYMLTVNTWVHGHIVYLGTYLLDRRKALACQRETKFINRNYHEYINVKFSDPWYLIYSDDWKAFRQNVCGETEVDKHEINNTGSVLNFTLYPVIESENGQYVKLDPYIGGQNAINISDSVSDYIGCDLDMVPNKETGELELKTSIHFNESFNDHSRDGKQTLYDLNQYMRETYDVSGNFYIEYNLMVLDSDNIYKIISIPSLDLTHIFTREEIAFGSWDGWKEGMKFAVNAILKRTDCLDMGLDSKLQWAAYNLDVNPEHLSRKEDWYGGFYAWGETEPTTDAHIERYKFIIPGSYYTNRYHAGFKRYIFGNWGKLDSYVYPVDGLTQLLPEDDAASVRLGNGWRMPTKDEIIELLGLEKEEVTNYKGVEGLNGILLTSVNGNTLFFPNAGAYGYTGGGPGYAGYHDLDSVNLWTSTLSESRADCAYICDFNRAVETDDPVDTMVAVARFDACSIRPIRSLDDMLRYNDGEDCMLLRSNQISITQDVMKYFIDTNQLGFIPKTINLDLVDMNNYTINAVNKIEKKIIQVDRPEDTKANLIKPAYFRARELNELTIHPAVTENICLNLDAYKARTTRFYLQIEGVTFAEYSRTHAGVIFKIVGANLAGEIGEGVCYLLNQDKELITTGKYKYEV